MALTPATPAPARYRKHIVSHRTSGLKSQTQFRVTLLTAVTCLIAPALLVPALGPAHLGAEAQSAKAAQPQQQPTFKVSVNVVDVDVTVKRRTGQFRHWPRRRRLRGVRRRQAAERFRRSRTSSCQSSARSGSASAGGPSRPTCARIATSRRAASTSSSSTT